MIHKNCKKSGNCRKESGLGSHPESGFSLIEAIISLAIILSSFGYSINIFLSFLNSDLRNKATAGFFSSDQLIRYEISKLMMSLQRRISETATNQQCISPILNNTFQQIIKERSVTESMVFGAPAVIRNIPSAFAEKTILETEQFIKAAQNPLAMSESNYATDVNDAWKRCQSQQTIRAGVDLRSRRSFYFCAFGENLIVEVKAVFWDFNRGIALTCAGLNEFPGRGVRATFRAYNYQKIPIKAHFPYSVKENIGSLNINKSVTQESWESL